MTSKYLVELFDGASSRYVEHTTIEDARRECRSHLSVKRLSPQMWGEMAHSQLHDDGYEEIGAWFGPHEGYGPSAAIYRAPE